MLEKLSKDDFWVITVDNLIQQNIQYRNWKKDIWKDRNTRDRQMAMNLKWLAAVKYPKEKIIVWTHNGHVSKYSGHFPKEFLNKSNTMGNIFTEDSSWMNKTYVIGFTSYDGTAGRTFENKYKVPKPKSNGFENWINKDYNYAFADFKRYNLLYPSSKTNFYMKCSLTSPYHRNEIAQWNKIFDGVFYIKDTYPCEKGL
jgi:erythromycin esterase-like protein